MFRYSIRSLTIWALICFAAPLLLLPISKVRGSGSAWEQAGLNDHAIISLRTGKNQTDGAPLQLFASTEGAGLWQLDLETDIWSSASAGLIQDRWRGASLASIIDVPAMPGLMLSMDEQGHLYRSFDGGQNWEGLDSPSLSGQTGILASSKAGSVYLASSSLFYRSEDAGQTWQTGALLSEGLEAASLAADLPTEGELLIGTRTGEILHSVDAGATWQTVQETRSSEPVYGLAGTPNGRLYAATASGLLHSNDEGVSWHLVSPTLQGQDIRALLVDHTHPHVLYAGLAHGGVYRSSDGGEDWSRLGRDLMHRTVTSLALDTTQQRLFAGVDDGVWVYRLPASIAPPVEPTATSTSLPTLTSAPTRTETVITMTPTASSTATGTKRPTRTPTPTKSATPTASRTPTRTATGTSSPMVTLTPTAPATATAAATATATAIATATEAATSTDTPAPPTATPEPATSEPPTDEPPSPTPPR